MKYISKETGVPKSTVHDIIKRYRKNKSLDRVGISGRKKILNGKDISYLINDIKKNPKSLSNEIRKKFEDTRGKKVTNTTIRNYLNNNQYFSCISQNKPFISKKNMVKRREFAKKYITYPNSFSNKVLFSDECKFELYGSSIKERHRKKFGSNNK